MKNINQQPAARSDQIYVVVPPTMEYLRDVVRGIARRLRTEGIRMQLFNEVGHIQNLPDRVRGFIALVTSGKEVEAFKAMDRPVVNISTRVPGIPFPSVEPNNIEAGRIAAEHLINHGHTSFAYLPHPGHNYSAERLEGFQRALRERGMECHVPELQRYTGTASPPFIGAWLRSLHMPLGLLVASDVQGRWVAQAAGDFGLRIPRDVAIVGVNNDEMLCELVDPPLTSVDLNALQIGYHAAGMMIDILRGKPTPDQPIRIEPKGIVVRESSDTLVVDNPVVARAMRYIREHATDPIDVGDVVSQLDVSRRSLERYFQSSLGRSPAKEIRRVQLDHARMLLSESDRSLKDVARAAGYATFRHFAQQFRREIGIGPSRYRKQFRLT